MRVIIVKKKTLLMLAVAIVIIAAVIVIACVACKPAANEPVMGFETVEEYELNVLSGKSRELPVYYVDAEDKVVALTIDAAWEDDKTAFILDTLARYEIKATFFLCGVWVKAYPEQVKAIHDAGHEVGNHSLTHPHMNKLDTAGVQAELSKLDDEIEAIIGKRSTLFRAPFGEYNDTVILAARSAGYEVVQWNIDTIDWKEERSVETILSTVNSKLSPGSIILCHNNGYRIKDYLPALIEHALEQGYSFKTVSELLLDGETEIDRNGMQKMKPA